MNQRKLTVFSASILVLGWLTHIAGAQTQPVEPISDADKQAAVITDQIKGSIAACVEANIAALDGKTPADQAKARIALISTAYINPTLAPSHQFHDEYCLKLGPALEMSLAPGKAMRTRLNAAIVLFRVAEASANLRLTAAIKLALADQSDGVALWGMKAARAVIPTELQSRITGQSPPILSAIAPALAKHPMGEIAAEAFDAGWRMNSLPPDQVKLVIPVVQQILSIRVNLYANGNPELPGVELPGATFLSSPNIWKEQTAEERVKSVQVLFDLLFRANQAKALETGKSDPKKASDLKKVVEGSAGAIQVIGTNLADPALSAAAADLIRASQQGQSPAQVAKLCDLLLTAIKANKYLAGVQQPPAVAAPASTTKPVGT